MHPRDSYRPQTTTTQAQTLTNFGKSQFESTILGYKIPESKIIEQGYVKKPYISEIQKPSRRYDSQVESQENLPESLQESNFSQFNQEQRQLSSLYQKQNLLPNIEEEAPSPKQKLKKYAMSEEESFMDVSKCEIINHHKVMQDYEINKPYIKQNTTKCACFMIRRNPLKTQLIDKDLLNYQNNKYISMSLEIYKQNNQLHFNMVYTISKLLSQSDTLNKEDYMHITDSLENLFQLQQFLTCAQLYTQYLRAVRTKIKLGTYMNRISAFILEQMKRNKLSLINEKYGRCYDAIRQLQMAILYYALESKDPIDLALIKIDKQTEKHYLQHIQDFLDFLDNKVAPMHLQ